MAAPGPNIAPAGANNAILRYTQDEANDVLSRNMNFSDMEYNGAGSTIPSLIRGQLTDECQNGIFNCVGMLDENGNLYLMSVPMRLSLSVVGIRNHADDGKLVGISGDLLNGSYYDYFIPTGAFAPLANTINCLSADLIQVQAAAAAVGGPRFTVGPHQDADAGVTPINTRKLFKIPFFLIQHFLALPEDADVGLSFWKDLYPMIVQKNLVVECKAIIDYFRVLVTLDALGSNSSLVYLAMADAPTPIGRIPAVVNYRATLLQRIFPDIFVDQATLSQNQHLSAMAASQDVANQIARDSLQFQQKQAAKKKHEKITKALGGSTGADNLLKVLGVATLADLPKVIQEMVDAAPGVARDEVLQRWLNKVATKLRCEPPPITNGTGEKVLRGAMHMKDDSQPHTGLLCNPFQWCTSKLMANALIASATLHDNPNVKVTKDEQAALEKSFLFFCSIDDIEMLVNHGFVLWMTITGENTTHPVVDFLKKYRTKVSTNKQKILHYPLREGSKYKDIIGVLIQIRLAEELRKYSLAIELGDPPPQLNENMIIDTVWGRGQGNPAWETYSSTMTIIERDYADALGVFRSLSSRHSGNNLRDELTVVGTHTNEFARLVGGAAGSVQPPTQGNFWDEVSQIPDEVPQAPPAPAPRPAPAARPAPPARPPAATRARGARVDNREETQRDLQILWGGLNKQCGAVKAAAKNGEHGVPPLPRSSVPGRTNDPMCLNWSVLLWCNSECEEKHDHIKQPDSKRAELKQWVQDHAHKVPTRQRTRRRGRGGNQGERE